MASYQEYSYFVEARQVQRLVDSETRWLDAGCGHQILELRLALEEKELVQRARLAVGCDAFVSSPVTSSESPTQSCLRSGHPPLRRW